MTNTFAHEINRVKANIGSRMQQMKHVVNRLLGPDGYHGHPAFDPIPIIRQSEEVDSLLESWLGVLIKANGNTSFKRKKNNLYKMIVQIVSLWIPMLKEKLIEIEPVVITGDEQDCYVDIAEVDVYAILNNFMLNSVWFLERSKVEKRIIKIELEALSKTIELSMSNNGIPLDAKYKNNPERIFYPGETSKETVDGEGTGIGLWITKLLVEEASGEIHVLQRKEGFGLKVILPR